MAWARKTNKLGLSAPNSNLERVKRNQHNTMMNSGAVSHTDEIDKGNKSSSSSSYKVSRNPYPLSFYTDSAVNHRIPIFKGNKSSESKMDSKNSITLSFYNTTAVYQPAPGPMGGESKMDICLVNEEFLPNHVKYLKEYPISFYFYMDRTISIPGLRINYIRAPTAVSKSSDPKSVAKIIFGSFGSQSSESKVSCFSSTSSESPFSESKSVAKIIFGSFGSQSSESKVIDSSKSKVSRNSIPDKLAFSILSKLSIKSLKRFGCVCKSWSILFENTDFMTMYSKHFISRHGSDDDYHTFIFSNDNLEFHLLENRLKLNLPSPLQPDPYFTSILGSTSVNGIFCIGQKALYVLWNPLTEEFMKVPPSPAELTPRNPLDMCLYRIFHGFGYDQLRDDFKVIEYVLFNNIPFESMPTGFIEIYSLKSNSWRMIHMDKDLGLVDGVGVSYNDSIPFNGLEVYVDGACHWLVSSFLGSIHVMTLLSFDLSDEVFLTTPIGEEPFPLYDPDRRLTVLNGSIALILNYHYHGVDDIVFHISILGELGVSESWIKLYTYGPLPSIQWPPIGFGKMGYMFFRNEDDEVAYVDLSTQIIEEVGIFTSGETSGFIGGLYKESLLSIGGSSN